MGDTFDDFLAGIQRFGGRIEHDPEAAASFRALVEELQGEDSVTHTTLILIYERRPEVLPALGLTVRLSQERLKNELKHYFGTPSWKKLARDRAADVIAMLDAEYSLVNQINEDLVRPWNYADVLLERDYPRARAGNAIELGRGLEDEVQTIVDSLGLPREMRTRFEGRNGKLAPCDLAIPAGGPDALIVVAIKAFNATGSKLSAAADEIQIMADVRQPTQFVYAIVDGMGWEGRKADLRRIVTLADTRAIDGLFQRASLPQFERTLQDACRRVGLVTP